jgi:DNA (cytosine-5)-methyltransferase 1
MTLRVLDLFSGIGGFSLGLERSGMTTVAFCEIEEYPRRVLARHWPEVPIYHDIRELTADRLREDRISVDLVCGGFPCQDISTAADAPAGLAGARSGLWREYARLVGELLPKFVIVENVSALCGNGLGDVLGDLASIGYDAEWHCIPASAIGAPHPRDRVWIVAYSPEVFRSQQCGNQPRRFLSSNGPLTIINDKGRRNGISPWWSVEPIVDRLVHGVPARVDRLGCASNAVVPMIPELIGRAILAAIRKV